MSIAKAIISNLKFNKKETFNVDLFKEEEEEAKERGDYMEYDGGSEEGGDNIQNLDDISDQNNPEANNIDEQLSVSSDEIEESERNSVIGSEQDVKVRKGNIIKRKKKKNDNSNNTPSQITRQRVAGMGYGSEEDDMNDYEDEDGFDQTKSEISIEEKLANHLLTLVLFSLGDQKASDDIYKRLKCKCVQILNF